MPIRLVELPTQEQAWRAAEAMISGIEEACLLNESTSIPAVQVRAKIVHWSSLNGLQVFLRLKARLLPSPDRSGYLRSYSYVGALHNERLTQLRLSQVALLFANPDVLSRPIGDQLFEFLAEVAPNIPLSSWVDVSLLPPPLSEESLDDFSEQIQRVLYKALIQRIHTEILPQYAAEYIGTFFSNRPRQRRNLCNLIPDWTSLCAVARLVLQSGLISEVRSMRLPPERNSSIQCHEGGSEHIFDEDITGSGEPTS